MTLSPGTPCVYVYIYIYIYIYIHTYIYTHTQHTHAHAHIHISIFTKVKGKGKVRSVTGHEGPEGGVEVQLYSFLNLGARWGWVVNATPRPL